MLLNPYRFSYNDFTRVRLLLPFDGADLSTAVVDASGAPLTATCYGDAIQSHSQAKFGPGSLKVNGTGYLGIAHATALNLVGFDFTIEGWVYLPTGFSGGTILNKDGAFGASYAQYQLEINGSRQLNGFLGNGNGTSPTGTVYNGSAVIPLNTWTHLVLQKQGANCQGYVAGVQQWNSAAATMFDGGKPLYLGFQTGFSPIGPMFFDDWRITKGMARYSGSFTPPTAAFPTS